MERKWVEMHGAQGHLGNLEDGGVSDGGNIAGQFHVSSFKSLLPETWQSGSGGMSVQIPHIPHQFLSLLHFLPSVPTTISHQPSKDKKRRKKEKKRKANQDVEIIVGGRVDVVGETGEVRGGPFKGDGASEHGPKGQ